MECAHKQEEEATAQALLRNDGRWCGVHDMCDKDVVKDVG